MEEVKSLNNIKFAALSNSENGEVSPDTIFHYREVESIVWGTYEGGQIRFGTLSGNRNGNKLEFQYQHQNQSGQFLNGFCESVIVENSSGLVELHETWKWLTKLPDDGSAKGTSVLIEIQEAL